jgi:hypothetical protein
MEHREIDVGIDSKRESLFAPREEGIENAFIQSRGRKKRGADDAPIALLVDIDRNDLEFFLIKILID